MVELSLPDNYALEALRRSFKEEVKKILLKDINDLLEEVAENAVRNWDMTINKEHNAMNMSDEINISIINNIVNVVKKDDKKINVRNDTY